MQGWIKLYRKLLADALWQCSSPEQKVVLVTLLLMANHSTQKWQWKGRPYVCQPGQMITSLNSIQHNCGEGISTRKIRTALLLFEKLGFLTNESTKQNRLITICHWDTYQKSDCPDGKAVDNQMTNKRQTTDKQMTTNKNVKKVKKVKNEKKGPFPSFEQQDIQQAADACRAAIDEFLKDPPKGGYDDDER